MKWKILVAIIFVVVVILLKDYISIDAILSFIESIRANQLAPFIFVVIYAFAVTIAIPAVAFTLLAGSIFGFWWGMLLVIIASNIGCHLSYWIAKLLGKDFVLRFIKEGSFLESATKKAKDNGFIFMMYARLIPLFPFVAVNYLSGIIDIKYRHYAIATLIGMIPGTAVYTYLGYSASSIQDNPLGIVVSIAILALFTIIVTVVQKIKSNKLT